MRKKILALLCCLLLTYPAVAGASGIPVVDILAWIQRAYAQVQRAEQIYHQVEQVRATVKSLESFGQGGSWSSLHGLLGELDQIFNTYSQISSNLGYLKIGVEQVYRDTFPGYSPPAGNWPDRYKTLLDRSHETLALLLAGQNRLTWNNTASQIRLAEMTAASLFADSPLQEAEVNNMFHTLEATELQKSTQATLLSANAATLATALELQKEATAAAARAAWLDAGGARPEPGYDPSAGYTGVPSSVSLSLF
ncbi:MAG TPA: hypothetical protein VF173_08685 [Thermoanaerobaculia bacterium]|nr:hypothetical protein [Thermoanaerobaculia bacterium]